MSHEDLRPWQYQNKKLEKWVRSKLKVAEKAADDYVTAMSTATEILERFNRTPRRNSGIDEVLEPRIINLPQHIAEGTVAFKTFYRAFLSLLPEELRSTGFNWWDRDVHGRHPLCLGFVSQAGEMFMDAIKDKGPRDIDDIIREWLGDSALRYKLISPIHLQLQKIENAAIAVSHAISLVPRHRYRAVFRNTLRWRLDDHKNIKTWKELWAILNNSIADPSSFDTYPNPPFFPVGRLRYTNEFVYTRTISDAEDSD